MRRERGAVYKPYRFAKEDWEVLLSSIQEQSCLPFLGAGACAGAIPLGGDIAEAWSDEHQYPFPDRRVLIRVAQYVALLKDPNVAKYELLNRWFATLPDPVADPPEEPHAVLARLPLPVYMTTNYDDFMVRALRRANRAPQREMCRWNVLIAQRPSVLDNPALVLHPANPIVFHLHGHNAAPDAPLAERRQCAASLVLTEDDYLELHVALNRPNVVPGPIRNALVSSSLLVIGYSLADTTFRALYRGLVAALAPAIQSRSFVVCPPPHGQSVDEQLHAQAYLERYFGALGMRVYWGDARTFARELWQRWEAFAGL